ncbi:MAG: hypothetical protein JO210_01655 [Acidobacteriaceae bacterium]|nr:hypothetical protein [Acidobacteriaceae bacterium]
MVFPTSFTSALLLLVLSFLCFSIWPNLYKRSERRWRFELFSLDFSIGAILMALLTAYTLGTLGSEMSFTDRMLVAGRAQSVWMIGAGTVFALGNMLLLPAITLLGMACAFAISYGTAVAVTAIVHIGHSHPLLLCGALACLLLCIASGVIAAGWATSSPAKLSAASRYKAGRVTAVTLAVLSGLALGGMQFVLKLDADPEFGPGPYASILMLALGILISTPALIFFFINIRITGEVIKFKLYTQGGVKPHFPGFLSGAIWASGTASVLVALSTLEDQAPSAPLLFLLPVSSVVVCILLGLFRWKEFSAPPPRAWLFGSIVSFAVGCALIAYGLGRWHLFSS